ncbi:HAD family hydrolase [Natrarchaeobius sp. A-rgal3]|uniref:HAD family hydrolase n=1 Tax=Natrarchaeobius versutus TaxID=1679078 RepID=UPI003510021F
MQYDAILFDFDGVLVETPSSRRMTVALERAYEKLGRRGPTAETFQEILRGDFDSIATRCRALEIDTDDFCTQAARELVAAQIAEVERGLRSAYDDVVAVRSLERPLGIVSDNHPTVIATLLERFGLESLFDAFYGCRLTPDGLARRKPDPRNIEDAMDALEAESALYVGDRTVDVQAAHNAGIDAALLSREDAAKPDAERPTECEPTYRLTSLAALPTIVR